MTRKCYRVTFTLPHADTDMVEEFDTLGDALRVAEERVADGQADVGVYRAITPRGVHYWEKVWPLDR